MDPISWLMIAQAGVSVVGELYNMSVNANNYNVQNSRIDQQLQQQKDAYGLQSQGIRTQFNQAQQDIASSASTELAQRIQAGQTNAYDLSASSEALKSNRLATQASQSFQSMGLQMDNTIQNASTAKQDLTSQLDAQNVNSVLSIGSTVLGAYAGLEKRAGDMGKAVSENLFGPPTKQLTLTPMEYSAGYKLPDSSKASLLPLIAPSTPSMPSFASIKSDFIQPNVPTINGPFNPMDFSSGSKAPYPLSPYTPPSKQKIYNYDRWW
jgi:hypothetical protein